MLPSSASELTRCILLRLDHQLTRFTPDDRRFAAAVLQRFIEWFSARQADELQQIRKDFDAFQAGVRNSREMRLQIALWQQGSSTASRALPLKWEWLPQRLPHP